MEGVLALGLVFNVIQLLEVSWKAAEACDQFYKHGTTLKIQEVRYTKPEIGSMHQFALRLAEKSSSKDISSEK